VLHCPAVTSTPLLPDDHFIALLNIGLTTEEDHVVGRAPVVPPLFAPGTSTLRSGPLTGFVDLVAGHTPQGPYGPTIDLRLQLFGERPTTGTLVGRSRPLRVGKRLIVSEVLLFAGDDARAPFGRAVTTFQHVHVGPGFLDAPPRPHRPVHDVCFDDILEVRAEGPARLVIGASSRVDNGVQGTVQGGAQAYLAELAAEHALGGGRRLVADDLDIRFLGRMHVGPLVATVRDLGRGPGDAQLATVALTDGGDGDKLVSHVALTMRPAG
jgi:acyl-coenzyme A thioesterase PaaI-like protein